MFGFTFCSAKSVTSWRSIPASTTSAPSSGLSLAILPIATAAACFVPGLVSASSGFNKAITPAVCSIGIFASLAARSAIVCANTSLDFSYVWKCACIARAVVGVFSASVMLFSCGGDGESSRDGRDAIIR